MNSYYANPRIRRRSGAPILWAYTAQGGRQTFPGDVGDVFDLAGRTSSGVKAGGCTWVDGPAGRALSTGSDFVDFGTGDLCNFTGSDFSVSFWCNPSTTGVPWVPVCRGVYQTAGWYLLLSSSTIALTCNTVGVNNDLTTTSTPFVANAAQHIAVVRQGTGGAIYWNGVAQPVTGTLASPASFSGGHLYLDRYNTGGDNMSATMWDVQIYDYALSANQVARDYADPSWRLNPHEEDEPMIYAGSASPHSSLYYYGRAV
jgi:hypothetical protein